MYMNSQVLWFFIVIVAQGTTLNYMKFTRVDWSTSGKTCKNPYCNVKPVSKISTFMNFGCDVDKPFDNIHGRLTGWMRGSSGGTWRQIISIQDFDICETVSNIENSGMFRESISWITRTFPGLWQKKCPFKAMKVTNASFQPYLIDGKPSFTFFPNGIYKFNMSMFNEADYNICELVYAFEVRYHFNLKDFK